MATPLIAANAYQNAAKLAEQFARGGADAKIEGAGGADFGAMVKSAVSELVDKGRSTDAKSVDMLQGKADVVDVVTAISETEIALETMVSVRDKVIAAYEEIMRMPI
ncbi:flagellar hook-basal body complex protein FliE [Breoghania sp. L-A4]|uniref:flagellar hook-basal body complex protein FliE n=1 Tax=Breoghania sp. L-A4 TaxID=2304600 RepID=UPI000E35C81C|nr:flagellar hook-basal body complex protein FliE [Breoghania sp. L-A4]AXS41200.1 flagellar hook-basal body complex protein FliE [Breoghania sp. L-A4]